jgi:hypothetical protein
MIYPNPSFVLTILKSFSFRQMQRATVSRCDQGIIRSLKVGFRKAMLKHLINEYEVWQLTRDPASPDKFPFHDHTHLRNALKWLKEAHDKLPDSVIDAVSRRQIVCRCFLWQTPMKKLISVP